MQPGKRQGLHGRTDDGFVHATRSNGNGATIHPASVSSPFGGEYTGRNPTDRASQDVNTTSWGAASIVMAAYVLDAAAAVRRALQKMQSRYRYACRETLHSERNIYF